MMEKIFGIASRMYRSIRPVRSESYKAFVRSFACICCGTMRRFRDAAHIGPHGVGQKASDLDTVPACRACHRELHRLGRVKFEMLHELDLGQAISDLQLMYTIRYGRLPGEDQRSKAA